ncbi:hypothetical protein C8Q80DRAFT_646280 [Daedaleopsis nitida]|nr:hypothetical protein C8Q80DRAFT_646280 [Daedaleopsis nitida]
MVRFKNRWLLVEFLQVPAPLPGQTTRQPEDLTSKQIWAALKQSILTHFGDTGWGAVGSSLTIKYFSPRTNLCIIRVARDPHKIAWASVTLMTAIDGRKFVPHVVHVSGTIKQAQLAAIRHNREVVARYRARAKTPGTRTLSLRARIETSMIETYY